MLDEFGEVLHVLGYADGAPGESGGGAGDVDLGVQRGVGSVVDEVAVAQGWVAESDAGPSGQRVAMRDGENQAFIGPFLLAGVGMGLFFAPMANVVLAAVRPTQQGQASGANNAIRELGGVLGVAVLAAVFASRGGYRTGHIFVAGMNPALLIGAVVVAAGAAAAFAIPRGRTATRFEAADSEKTPEPRTA